MDNIELYINGNLCDTGKNFGVRLRRQMISPAELNTKDAQASYSVTLPITHTNDRVFNYASVEEVKGKFVQTYEAELIINSHRVFKGNFRISKIGKDGYKGNLVVPVAKTVKDVFGDSKLTDNAPFFIDFKDFAGSVSNWNKGIYNKSKYGDIPPCIFPYVLYGLLPKVPQPTGITEFSDKDLWDSSVRVGVQDLPPSINVLSILKKVFEGKRYTLTGTAFDDIRLKSLYISYKNESSYQQEWNWGDLASISVDGTWAIADHDNGWNYRNFERQIALNDDDYGGYYTVNLFNSNKVNLSFNDSGTNVTYSEYKDKYTDKDYTRKSLLLSIPKSGYYKVRLTCDEFKLNNTGEHLQCRDNNNKFTSTRQSHRDRNNRFDRSRYEIQVLRDFGTGEFRNTNIVGFYNRPQFPQSSYDDRNQYPKYYPKAGGPMVVDPSVNENFICGLHWGRHEDDYNPMDANNKCNYMFIASGFSWNKLFTQGKKILSAYSSWGLDPIGNYWCWGTKDEESETPIEDDLPNPIWLSDPIKRRYGRLNNYADNVNYVEQNGDVSGKGRVECIIWLEKGESLTVGVAGDMGDMRRGSSHHTEFDQWIVLIDNVKFKLDIEPFRVDLGWNNFTNSGSYDPKNVLSWTISPEDPANFQKDAIDLVKFLPNDVRTDEFIDNFCKAFNLKLSQTGTTEFTLDVKQTKKAQQNNFIDIDTIASVQDKANQPLGLPSAYSIGFTIDEDEEGPTKIGDNGGGLFYTGAPDGGITEQKSNFSFNWFKTIRKAENGNRVIDIPLPVISKAEAWKDSNTLYSELAAKRYTDLAQRFWYFDGLLNSLGVTFNIGGLGNEKAIELAKVTNTLPGLNTLSYKDENNTILNNYFSLLTDANSHYTLIECYLQPEQYEEIGNGAKVRFNGDLYYVADVDGYDPLNKNMSTLKLIRLI